MVDMRILLLALALTGCAAAPKEVIVTYEFGTNGEVVPVVDGKRYELTEAEKRKQIQAIVSTYCAAQ